MTIQLAAYHCPTQADRVIDLDGQDGNAFFLMAIARNFAIQLGYATRTSTSLRYDKMMNDMRSGDYFNLVAVFHKNFGEYVTLVTKNEALYEHISSLENEYD